MEGGKDVGCVCVMLQVCVCVCGVPHVLYVCVFTSLNKGKWLRLTSCLIQPGDVSSTTEGLTHTRCCRMCVWTLCMCVCAT